MDNTTLVGTWKLVSMEHIDETGAVSYPYGPDAAGYIMYGADGWMAVEIMSAGRPPYPADYDQGEGLADKAMAADTYLSYCGQYRVVGDRVVHHVEISLHPNQTGVALPRYVALDGDRLTLSGPPVAWRGRQRTARITWQRLTTAR